MTGSEQAPPGAPSDRTRGEAYCRVRGRVQGVGFRWYVKDEADALGLSGYVKNCPDGSVEVSAAGPVPCLKRLVETVRRGPPGARVLACDETWSTMEDGEAAEKPGVDSARPSFRIRY